jgi:uncharacterized membrane protein YccC
MWRALRSELHHLTHVNPSGRPWEMPLAAAITSGVPLAAGAWFGRMDYGLIASLGGFVFLSLPDTPMRHRMVLIMAVAFGMIACYALGALTHFFPPTMIVALTLICVLAGMVARFYRLGPPGILFLMMAASIAAYTPATLLEIPLRVGLVALGALFACVVAFIYSLYQTRRSPPSSDAPAPGMNYDYVVVDSVIIGTCVGVSMVLAELLQLERPYWVPISCLAVIQGANLRMVWNRHAQRVLGTLAGLALAWLLLELHLNQWSLVAAMVTLTFLIETLVVRHYGLAVIFITPLTIFLAEATGAHQQAAEIIMQARAVDIAVGSFFGLAGGAALHVPAVRSRVVRVIGTLFRIRA